MKTKNIFLIFLFLWGLDFLRLPVHGESFKLKTGKVIEGQIVEKGDDYLKIQTETGELFRVRLNQMEDQGEPNSGQASLKNEFTSVTVLERLAEELTKKDWEERIEGSYSPYFKKTGLLAQEFSSLLGTVTRDTNRALKKNQIKQALNSVRKAVGHLQSIRERILSLEPEEELAPFHKKFLETIDYQIKAFSAWQLTDMDVYYRYTKKSFQGWIAWLEEFSAFNRTLGFSPESYQFVDAIIPLLKTELKDMFY